MGEGEITTLLLPAIGLRASAFLTNFERTRSNVLGSISLLLNATFKVNKMQS